MAKTVYICAVDDCRKVFSKPSRLVQHARTHTGEVSCSKVTPMGDNIDILVSTRFSLVFFFFFF